jgi:hypothetical protein
MFGENPCSSVRRANGLVQTRFTSAIPWAINEPIIVYALAEPQK